MRRVVISVAVGVLVVGCSRAEPAAPVASGPAPSPAMSPAEVVRAVTEAMRHNDSPGPDSGIATAFRFASPANRMQTGPLERFIPMVKNPAYAALLNCTAVELGPGDGDESHARQIVTVTTPAGNKVTYLFGLTKQTYGTYKDCWMTDAVMPVQQQTLEPPTTRPGEGEEQQQQQQQQPARPVGPRDSGATPM